jgi:hypothetical protein
VPVIERPELARILLRPIDELSLIVAGQVAHWPFSLCRFKREAAEAGYEVSETRPSIINPLT